jgi:hypothetical protein
VIRHQTLEHRFVRNVPREMEAGVLCISMDYATAVHSCCCGCGDRVVTPFTPTDWRMTFDGETISLHPSVGNWNQKCRSHYVIRRNHVLEAAAWSNSQIEAERRRDKLSKGAYYSQQTSTESLANPAMADHRPSPAMHVNKQPASIWSRLAKWFTN